MQYPYTIYHLGDSAVTISFGNGIDDELNRYVLAVCGQITGNPLAGVLDVVPAYSSLTLHYDPVTLYKEKGETPFQVICNKLKAILAVPPQTSEDNSRLIKVPVCYQGAFAPDLGHVADWAQLPVEEVVHLHCSLQYRVYMIGFLPGFAYMGSVHNNIAMPRKQKPAASVPRGSVGIAGGQTGIYPFTSPGGWQIIGTTPLKLFDKERQPAVFFMPGDRVQFIPILPDEFNHY